MVHDLELLDKDALHGFHVAERHRRVLQQAVGYLRVDNLVDELADAFLRMFFEAARSGFDRIGHHDDCGLFRERIRAWIGEERFVDRAVRILVLIGIVEILRLAAPVVRADEIDDFFRESRFLGNLDAFGHVADDALGALFERKGAVRVHSLDSDFP